jgi:hypothetical protein
MIFAPRGSRVTGTAFKDFLFLCVLGFIAMVIWLLPHINPPKDADKAEPPGNVIIAITWPEGDVDIDMWITGPGEKAPVGYSNKSGVLFNLLRDDLGRSYDPNPLKTALRFRLDKDGKLVPGSMNNVFRQLRAAQPGGM